MKTALNKNDVMVQDGLFLEVDGFIQPAWKHEDGTIVSHWDNLTYLTVQNTDGTIEQLTHDVALEMGYEF